MQVLKKNFKPIAEPKQIRNARGDGKISTIKVVDYRFNSE